MRKLIALMLCSLFIAGCSNVQYTEPTMAPIAPVTEAEANANTNRNIETAELISVSVPSVIEKYYHEDGTELFSYMGQHMQMIHPDVTVADKIILDFLNRVDTVQQDVESIHSESILSYDLTETWYPYYFHIVYSPTRIDRDVLSLTGTKSSFGGSSLGITTQISVNYDMLTGDILTWGSIMHENATKDDFVTLILEKLDDCKDEYYLFDDYKALASLRFECDENFYEDFYFTNTGLAFYFSPYEIAPNASGTVTVEIPYEELPGILHDSYFPAERDTVQGTMHHMALSDANLEQYENMTEVTISSEGITLLIAPEGSVEDIRITMAGDGRNIPEYTIFASPAMSDKDAIVLQASQEQLKDITIYYNSDGSMHTLTISY